MSEERLLYQLVRTIVLPSAPLFDFSSLMSTVTPHTLTSLRFTTHLPLPLSTDSNRLHESQVHGLTPQNARVSTPGGSDPFGFRRLSTKCWLDVDADAPVDVHVHKDAVHLHDERIDSHFCAFERMVLFALSHFGGCLCTFKKSYFLHVECSFVSKDWRLWVRKCVKILLGFPAQVPLI